MSNVSQTTKVVKDFDEKSIYFLRFALQDEAQYIVKNRLSGFKNKDFCNCHKKLVWHSTKAEVLLNHSTRRAYWNKIVTCANPALCPVCSPRISSFRSEEISNATMQHLQSDPDNCLYLLTLTCRHSSSDYLPVLLDNFKSALAYFFRLKQVQQVFLSAGVIGRITAHEVTYSQKSGFHPHCHILLFGRRSSVDVDYLTEKWLHSLDKFSLSGLSGIALDFEITNDIKNYLTKISQELVFSHSKQGRGDGHFSPMELLSKSSGGETWAGDAFSVIFSSYYRRHLLHWSRGLKEYFGIKSASDEDIAANNADSVRLLKILEIPRKHFLLLSHYKKAEILSDVTSGNLSGLRQFLSPDFLDKKNIFC